jgi:benzoyl-CoA-dihydrodiol lyase
LHKIFFGDSILINVIQPPKETTMGAPDLVANNAKDLILFDIDPTRYQHWSYTVSGDIATLKLDIQEDGGIRPGYKLKLNSYDLGVDIELNDAVNRIRFEHPEVKAMVMTSGKPKMFCSGANIYMLGVSSHGWKVNFCKFTNETRNGLEDTSTYSGLKSLAAVNGICAGGGYELALACDEILMIDDRSSTVSLPEVPLLGVLPGTGGLTRIIDKRKMRRDLADIFCTTSEGVRADRAQSWKLVDHIAKPQVFDEAVKTHAGRLAQASTRKSAAAVKLGAIKRTIDATGYHYELVDVKIDRAGRVADITITMPAGAMPANAAAANALGDQFVALKLVRELEDAILMLRGNDAEVGLWTIKSKGAVADVQAMDAFLHANTANGFIVEIIGYWRRLLSRFDVSSRSIFALVEPGSCFAGTFLEIALTGDRVYMLDSPEPEDATVLGLTAANFGTYPMASGVTRINAHYAGEVPATLADWNGKVLTPTDCNNFGLVTATPDELDWADEVRLAVEERASLSPDALTGMEASLRFAGPETMNTRVFGRLSAWQNWIFYRPNATGADGALKLYGSGTKAKFDWKRV